MYHEIPRQNVDGGREIPPFLINPEIPAVNTPKEKPFDFEAALLSPEVQADLMKTCYALNYKSRNQIEDAKDLFNTTIASALKSKNNFKPNQIEPINSWLNKLAHNRFIEQVRKTKAVKRGGGIQIHESLNEVTTKSDTLSETELLQQVQIGKILEKMKSSTDKYTREEAKILELTFFEGLTVEEIANEMDMSEATVKRKKNAGLEKMKMELEHK
jgi:RNA polymerase sigma factor (sigma-70 family)